MRPRCLPISAAAARCWLNSSRFSCSPKSTFSATNEPLPCLVTITPSRSSSRYARFTVITLTRVSTASALIDGSSCPGFQSPIATRMPDLLDDLQVHRAPAAWEIVRSLCISLCTVYTARRGRKARTESRPANQGRRGPQAIRGPAASIYTVDPPGWNRRPASWGWLPGQQSSRAQRPRVGAC